MESRYMGNCKEKLLKILKLQNQAIRTNNKINLTKITYEQIYEGLILLAVFGQYIYDTLIIARKN